MKRIDPSAVPAMFERLGITPIRGTYTSENRKGECGACLVGVIAADATSWDQVHSAFGITRISRLAELNRDYADGLSAGWERFGNPGIGIDPDATKSYRLGYTDGAAARQACGDRVVDGDLFFS